MIMLPVISPFSSFIPWKRRTFLRGYCACWSTCASIFFKSSCRTDTWSSKLLIIFSLNSLLASNLLNFYERKLTVLARSVSFFSPLIWFSFKYLCLRIFCLICTLNFLSNQKEYFYSLKSPNLLQKHYGHCNCCLILLLWVF